jgi:hypothetical protein
MGKVLFFWIHGSVAKSNAYRNFSQSLSKKGIKCNTNISPRFAGSQELTGEQAVEGIFIVPLATLNFQQRVSIAHSLFPCRLVFIYKLLKI